MKQLLTILLIFFSFTVFGQGGWVQPNTTFGTKSYRASFDSTMFYPTGCGTPVGVASLRLAGSANAVLRKSALFYDSCSAILYVFNPVDSTWSALVSGSAGASNFDASLIAQGATPMTYNGTTDFNNTFWHLKNAGFDINHAGSAYLFIDGTSASPYAKIGDASNDFNGTNTLWDDANSQITINSPIRLEANSGEVQFKTNGQTQFYHLNNDATPTQAATFITLKNDSNETAISAYGAQISGSAAGGAIVFHNSSVDPGNEFLQLGVVDNDNIFTEMMQLHHSNITGNKIIAPLEESAEIGSVITQHGDTLYKTSLSNLVDSFSAVSSGRFGYPLEDVTTDASRDFDASDFDFTVRNANTINLQTADTNNLNLDSVKLFIGNKSVNGNQTSITINDSSRNVSMYGLSFIPDSLNITSIGNQVNYWNGAYIASDSLQDTTLFINNHLGEDENHKIWKISDDKFAKNTIQNGCISGCTVTWVGPNYDYIVAASQYYINGTLYSSPQTTVTLDPGDPTNDRIDLFILTTSSTADKITGTPANPALYPDYDVSAELPISFAVVGAGTTAPTITTIVVYKENAGTPTEWAYTDNSATLNPASTNNPYAGSIDIEGTNVISPNRIILTPIAMPDLTTVTQLNFQIRSKAGWGAPRRLLIQFFNSNTPIGNPISFGQAAYGFNSNQTATYQNISVPLADFGNITGATNLRITRSGGVAGTTIGFYIDNILLINQAGSTTGNQTITATLPLTATTNSGNTNIALTTPLTVPFGGSGLSAMSTYQLIAGGTTSTNALQQVSIGSAGQVLTSNGPGALPTFQAGAAGSLSNVYAPLIKSGDTISQRFNVLHYGADNTGATDATIAIQNTINAAAAAGGDVIVPVGVYKIAGPLQTSVGGINYNSQLYIPTSTATNTSRNHVRIIGESPPNFTQTGGLTGSVIPALSGGVIFYSTLASGSATGAAVIGTNKLSGAFSYEYMSVENLMIKVKNNPTGSGPIIGGVSSKNGPSIHVRNFVYTIDTAGDLSTLPGNDIAGIETPDNSSESMNTLENTVVIGVRNAYKIGEHTNMSQVQSFCCFYGFNFKLGGHTVTGSRICAYWCKYDIYVRGESHWLSMNLDNEWQQIGKWYDNVTTVVDTANLAHGTVIYQMLNAGVAIDNSKFTISGGSNITAIANDAGMATTKAANSFSARNTFTKLTEFDSTILLKQTGSGASNNIIYVGSTSSGAVDNNFGIAVAGVGSGQTATTSPWLLMRGNNYSTSAQRGNIAIGAGSPSSPSATEGSITMTTGADAQRLFIDKSGNISFGASSAFYWDNVNNQLSIGAANTTASLNAITNASSGVVNAYFRNLNSAYQTSFYVENDRGSFASYGGLLYGGSTQVTSLFGLTRADKLFLFADGASNLGFAIGNLAAQPVIFGTNNLERLRISGTGSIVFPSTVTAGGTTGNQTINKPSGTVNIAAAGTTVTVTNSLVTTSSIIIPVLRTNDATAIIKNIVPGSGSFVINLNAAATAEISIGFFVIN